MKMRTHTCGELRKTDLDERVRLCGWVDTVRDHGGVIFIDLRDRYGLTQIIFDPNDSREAWDLAQSTRGEYVIQAEGVVESRPPEMANPRLATGEIEVRCDAIRLLNKSRTPPFPLDDQEAEKVAEDLRLTYRYLDLRRPRMQNNMRVRHLMSHAVRRYLDDAGFTEVETPILTKSTPEGARDYLVPSRVMPGTFYALPQAPQQYKQLLMMAGVDRYFQIAHCFRDEDARGDRQPEHTQIDIEMSFVGKDDVFTLVEGMFTHVFSHTIDRTLETPFVRLAYDDALNRYGSDKPDLRFDLELRDFGSFAADSDFKVFTGVLESGGAVKALVVPGAAEYSRKQISDLEETAKTYGAKGLAWMKLTDAGLDGGVSKFFASRAAEVSRTLGAVPGDLLLFVADAWTTACTALGAVRARLGRELGLIDPSEFRFAWIVDFPLFEWNEDKQGWDASHHMFTMPQEAYLSSMESDPGSVKGDLYDLVCNGVELASGSVRIHDPEIQRRIFSIVGFPEDEAERRFGFLLESFRYGAPPHGGIAPGLDRLVMLMAGETTIREVIAFPKNTVGVCPMDDSPSTVDQAQLDELGIRVVEPPPDAAGAGEPADGSARADE